LGLLIVADRRGKHGRVRSRRLALRQVSERARSHRQAMERMIQQLTPGAPEWDRVRGFTAPVGPDRKVIR
jgi:hypothetical protein